MYDPHYVYDVFISYSHEDSEVAQRMATRLKELCANGSEISIFLDKWSITPGDSFVDRINTGLLKSHYYLLLLSPASIKAEWPTAERDAALLEDPSGRGGRVVPILVKDCDIPPLLAIRHWIDARDKHLLDAGMASLASKITGKSLPHGVPGNRSGAPSAVDRAAPARLYSHEPDAVDEVLYTNLYRAKRIPTIRSASTEFSTRKLVQQKLKRRLPAFTVSGGRLYTSSEIELPGSALRPAIDAASIENVPFKFWLESDDNKRILTTLLNIHANHRCNAMGLTYDEAGKRFYGDRTRVTSRKLVWKSHTQKRGRALILPYKNDDGIQFYRHRAVRLSFHMLGREVFLQIRPGWTFTDDGSAVIEDQKRRSSLNTRLRSYSDNDDEFGEQRFWAWLLSKGRQIEMGERGNPVQIEYLPLNFASQAGVSGDHLHTPFDQDDPPSIALDDSERGAVTGSGDQ